MYDLIKEYLIFPNIEMFMRVILIPFITLGIVFGIGKLLEVVHSHKAKNRIAFFVIILLAYFTDNFTIVDLEFILNTITVASLSNIVYVTICWKLYPRIENLLDAKIASSKIKETPVKKRKKK